MWRRTNEHKLRKFIARKYAVDDGGEIRFRFRFRFFSFFFLIKTANKS